MKVKTYRASTVKAALEQIKLELGVDAFILSQKQVRPPTLLGMSRKSYVEVTAAVDYSETKSSEPASTAESSEAIHDAVHLSAGAVAPPRSVPPLFVESQLTATAQSGVLLNEIRKLRLAVQSLSSDRTRPAIWLKDRSSFSPSARQAFGELIARGIHEDIALNVVSNPGEAVVQIEDLRNAIVLELSRQIHIHENLTARTTTGSPQIVALLGPTGVGKTTTLAKIAARAVLEEKLSVGLITLDTFRIAAIDQLKTYAEIIGVPVRVVENVKQMSQAIETFSDRDLVLIDTTGRSQHALGDEFELAEFMSQSVTITKALVLSATTKQSDLADIIDRYEIFGTNCLIFTKLDETDIHGPIVNELVRSGKPLAFVTTGQAVPQDILRPDDKQIVELAVGANQGQRWKVFVDLAHAPHKPAELLVTCQ